MAPLTPNHGDAQRPPQRRAHVHFLLGIAVAVAAVGGVGLATGSIPDSKGTLYLCYQEGPAETSRGGAALRIFDEAKNKKGCDDEGQRQLVINQRGRRGPSGVAGPVYENRRLGPHEIDDRTIVATLRVPFGNYVVNAKVSLASAGNGEPFVGCRLLAGYDGRVVDRGRFERLGGGSLSVGNSEPFPLHAVLTKFKGTVIDVVCETGRPRSEPVNAYDATLTAIRVGAVERQ